MLSLSLSLDVILTNVSQQYYVEPKTRSPIPVTRINAALETVKVCSETLVARCGFSLVVDYCCHRRWLVGYLVGHLIFSICCVSVIINSSINSIE